jgi:hypothetical protein
MLLEILIPFPLQAPMPQAKIRRGQYNTPQMWSAPVAGGQGRQADESIRSPTEAQA